MGKKKTVKNKPNKQKKSKAKIKRSNNILDCITPFSQVDGLFRNKVFMSALKKSNIVIDKMTDYTLSLYSYAQGYIDKLMNEYYSLTDGSLGIKDVDVIFVDKEEDTTRILTDIDYDKYILSEDFKRCKDGHIKDLNFVFCVDRYTKEKPDKPPIHHLLSQGVIPFNLGEEYVYVTRMFIVYKNKETESKYRNHRIVKMISVLEEIIQTTLAVLCIATSTDVITTWEEVLQAEKDLNDDKFFQYVKSVNGSLFDISVYNELLKLKTLTALMQNAMPGESSKIHKILGGRMARIIDDMRSLTGIELLDFVLEPVEKLVLQLLEVTKNKEGLRIKDFSTGDIFVMSGLVDDDFDEANYMSSEFNKEGLTYIDSYRELNSLATDNGYTLVRNNGDHGVYKNQEGYVVVIPQGRTIGKGLSLQIQKSIKGSVKSE